jgi:hypothetical protein
MVKNKYSEWIKKNISGVTVFHAFLMIITMILNGWNRQYLHVFGVSCIFFCLILSLSFRFLSGTKSLQTLIQIFILDIVIPVLFFYSLFGVHKEIVSVTFWGVTPGRWAMVFFAKKYSVI